MHTDDAVMRYLGMPPWQRMEECLDYIYKNVRSYRAHGFGRFVTIRRSDETLLGLAGLLVDQHEGFIDLGYRLFPNYWGKGYATEAARAIVQFGFETLELDEIVALVAEKNERSERVLEKLGMRFAGERICMGISARRFEMSRECFGQLLQ